MYFNKVSKHVFSPEAKLGVAAVVLFFLACVVNQKNEKPVLNLSKQDTAININKDLLVFLSAGNKRLLTDLIWVQTLIESDVDHYKKRDLNSWLFLRFNTVASLDPYFYQNYLYGGLFLAIIKDDLEGADVIYDKGLAHFPEDYRLNYNAGFLNYYEMGNTKKGLAYLEKVQDHPRAPVFLRSIINKLRLDTGASLEEVYQLVRYHHATTDEEKLKAKLGRDLYSIKAEIDLTCLNNRRSGCDHRDWDGDPYVRRGDRYHTAKPFLPYRINKRGETTSPLENQKIDTF